MWKRTKIVWKINWHEKLNMLKSKSLKTRRNADGRRDTCPQTTASIFDASNAPGCSRLAHGHTPLQSERLQNRKADHEWPESLQWLYSEKRIPELHFKINLCGLSDHRGVAANGLNIVEFQFRSGDLNSSTLRFISFLWSSEEDSAGSLCSAERLLQQEHPFLQLN